VVLAPQSALPAEPPAVQSADWLARVNFYRALAGVPPVGEDAALSENCRQHARYMAENDHLTHDQDTSRAFASPAGQTCAQKGDVWLGQGAIFSPADAVDGWLSSVGHRLWLLYPTTPAFGFGFYSHTSREGAALDVLSHADFGADAGYARWPVRYPGDGQLEVRPGRTPITLLWRYFGPVPQLDATRLRTQDGEPVAHTADTNLPGGHKGVQILPLADLPANTLLIVEATGTYEGAPFSASWRFSTGDVPFAAASEGCAECDVADTPLLPPAVLPAS
jgi:hypothetical protein